MKRFISFIMILFSVFILSSCSSMNYEETNYKIGSYDVFRYDHFSSERVCDRISRFGLFVRDGEEDYLTDKDFGECMNTLFVKEKGDYYNLSQALTLELFVIEDVLEVEWDFAVYPTHTLLDYTEVDYFVFRTSVSEVYEDADNIERVLEISESIYQSFIIGYYPDTLTSIGYIDVFHNETLIVTLEVYEQGIFDSLTTAFQESYTSELFGLFQSVMN